MSVISIEAGSPPPGSSRIMTTGCGWSVRHQRTERWMIGTSRKSDDPHDGREPGDVRVGPGERAQE